MERRSAYTERCRSAPVLLDLGVTLQEALALDVNMRKVSMLVNSRFVPCFGHP